jgi:anti-sigma regulatory factor (Ser/Thr protein kinase)
MPAEVSLDLPRDTSASRIARRALRAQFADPLPADRLRDLDLVVTELVNNAVSHGEGAIRVSVQLEAGVIRGEVIDEGEGFERQVRRRGVDEVGGRGLQLVEDLASRWGIHEGTTHVWFEMPSTHVWFELDPAATGAAPAEPELGEQRRPPELDETS